MNQHPGNCVCATCLATRPIPCPCCACNPVGTARRYASLAEEAHAHARWLVFGCPNSKSGIDWAPGVKVLEVRWFPKTLFARGHAWSIVDDGHQWIKSHTAQTWSWYRVIT